ncbi:tandem-95 repeat protein [Bradyrhizobium oligotrophicum]|uniref:T1SS-143 repeat domain-containing protein n=1 Tax=Bradyrhizobium oligotrophicum TaxID=44255 RepID=UPI003EB7112C
MNAPVLLAQLTGTSSQPSSASAKHLKIGKPQGSQAVTVHLDGQSQIDLSDIASEKLTFVKIGNRLIILFDNQSTVSIDPVFDANGAPLKEVSFEVGPDRIINGDQFAELFPMTTDQSVLPAAGTPGAPGVPAGANFGTYRVDALNGGTPLALLGGEDGSGNFGDNPVTPANGTPIPGGADAALINEDGLSEGQPGGLGDVGGLATSFTGSLHVDFGTDVVGRAFQFAAAQPGLAGLTSGGQEVHFTITTVNGQPELIGYIGSDPSIAANHVFTITLDADSTIDGTYTVTLLRPLDHSVSGTEDTLNLTLNIIAIDGSGDTAPFTLQIGINDDSPVAGTVEAINVAEHTGSGGESGGSEDGPSSLKLESGDGFQPTTASVDLHIGWGADSGNSSVDGGTSGTVVVGDRSLVFASSEIAELEALGLTSNGEAISYTLSGDGTSIVATAGEGESVRTIFTVSLSDTGSGSATFTLSDNVDHNGANDASLPLTFHVVATDADGDPVDTSFTVNVGDDGPTFGEKPSYSVVDEDGLGNAGNSYDDGNDADGEDLTITDTLGIRWGSDDANHNVDGGISGAPVNGDRAVTFAADVVATLDAQNLTSNGFALHYDVSGNGTVLTAYRTDGESYIDADGHITDDPHAALVFTVSLSDQGLGSYTFRLTGNLDHPVHGTEDDITLNLGFVATDSDGDAITDTFTVKVNDDAPTFGEKPSYSVVDEDGLGNAGDSYIGGNDAYGEDLTVTDSLGIRWGADSANSHVDGGLGEAPVNGDRAVTFAADVVATLDAQNLTSNGIALTYVVSENGTLLTAYRYDSANETYVDADGKPTESPESAAVFTVSLSDQGLGSYTFTLSGNLDHPAHGGEDDITLNLGFVATDSDGDAVTDTFTVKVNDDAPVFGEKPSYSVVDENGLGNAGDSYKGGNDADGEDLTVTDSLGIQWGADSANSHVDGGIDGAAVNGDRAVTFAADVIAALDARNLTSDGYALHYVLSEDGTVLTAYRYDVESYIDASGHVTSDPAAAQVFTVTLSDQGQGSYTFTLTGSLDHPTKGAEDDLTLDFGVVATDSDGDAVTSSFTVKVNDDAPVFGERVSYSTVDEDGLGNAGNSYADSNDAYGAALQVKDYLGIRWGADDANSHVDGGINGGAVNGDRAVTFASDVVATLAAQHLTSNGVALTYVVSADGTQLAAYRYDAAHHTYVDASGNATSDQASAAVFTVSLSDQGQGSYTFTLIDNIDHPIRNTEDSITLTLGFVATDSDGDAISDTFKIKLNDDAPVLNREIATGVVDEDGLSTGLPGGPGDVAGQATVATGALGISWGADSANTLGNVGITGASPVTGDRAVTFASDATTTLAAQHLTSNGIALSYALSEGGTLITAYRFDGQHYIDANGNWTSNKANAAVFTVKLSDAESGSYTFTLLDNLDHQVANTEDNIALTLKYVATDSDGDQVSGSFKVNVNDDSPEAHTGTAKSISEADITAGGDCGPDFAGSDFGGDHGGGGHGGGDASVTGALNIKWGADNNDSGTANRSVGFTNGSNAAADVHVTNGSDMAISGLTSDGQTVKYAFDHGVLVGYTGSSLAYGQRVFEVSLDDDGTGSYTFTLLGNLDHPAGQGENVVKLTFDYTAVDSDGDASSSTFTVTVVDDVPTIGHADNETVSEANLPTDGYDLSHPDSTYSTVQTGGLAISWGADDNDSGAANRSVAFNNTTAPQGLTSNGYAISYMISADGTTLLAVTNDHRTVFTVTLSDDGDGSYKFTLLDNIDHGSAGADSLTLSFGYRATDSDGDSATSSFTVSVKDDVPVIGNVENESVSEAYLPTDGYDTSHPDASNSTVQTGDLDISWGADDNNTGTGHNRSVVFTTGAGATGLTSDGSPISYAISGDGTLLTASSADGRTIFTIQLSDSGDGSYKVTLLDNIDHPASGASDDSLALTFGFKATDSDGDSATGSFKVTVLDTAPVAGKGDAKTVDEDDLANGTDASKESTTVSGDLNISWGADDNNKTAGGGTGDRSVAFSSSTASANVDAETSSGQNITLTSDGQTVKYALLNGVLVGYTGSDSSVNHVFEVSLSDQNDGSYTFKLLGNLDHPAGSGENVVNLTFSYTATDGDGDTSSNHFTVSVKDDVPVIGTSAGTTLTENTTGVAGAEVFQTQTAANVALNINWGADDGNSGAANRGVAFDSAIHSGDYVKTTGSGSPTLTSNGTAVQFIRVSDTEIWGVANDNGGQLTTADRVVFKITLSDSGTGSYTVQLLDNVDHTGSGQTSALALKLGFTAVDADGDAATGNFTVTINDDNGRPSIGTPVAGTVDEDGLSGGNTAAAPGDVAGANVAATGSLAISWGADDNNSGSVNRAVGFSGITNGQSASSDAGLLTVDGAQVKYWVVGNTLYGYTGSNPPNGNTAPAAANQVFKITLDDSGAGSYSFTLLKHVDHPAGQGENDVKLTFGFTATDADGDSTNSSFAVTINDDSPVATATVLCAVVEESELPNGSVKTITGSYGGDLNGDGNGNDSYFTGNLTSLVSFGADKLGTFTVEKINLAPELLSLTSGGVALTYSIDTANNMLVAKAGSVTIFEFQVDATTGQYSFRLKGALDHVGTGHDDALTLDLSTAVTATDSDGDSVALHDQIIITVNDDSPQSRDVATVTISEAAGNVSTGAVDLRNTYGADGDSSGPSVTFSGASPVRVYDAAHHQMSGLTSLGFGLTYVLSADHTTLTAYRMSGGSYIGQNGQVTGNAADAAVFVVTLSEGGTGSYNFTLLQPLDHPAPIGTSSAADQYLDLNFSFAVEDRDHDTFGNNFTVRVDAAGTATTTRYDAPNSPVFVNLSDSSQTVLGETVGAHSVTDRASVTDKVVGTDRLGGVTEAHGSGGDDILVGSSGADALYGGAGNDVIRGGAGDDRLFGGAGNDTFLYTVGDGGDVIDGGSETGSTDPNYDVLAISGDANARNFTIGKATTGTDINPTVNDGGANATDILVRYDGPNGATIRADEIERVTITGGSASDTLTITDITGTAIAPATIVFNGGSGNDTLDLIRFAGNTSVVSDGGADNDTVKFGFKFADATYTKVFAADGTTLIGIQVTHNGVTDTFTNYESFVFTDGTRTLTGVFNTPPVAHDDTVQASEDNPLSLNALLSLLNNDTDVDNNTLTVTGVANATHGTVTLTNGNPVFTPDKNFSGVAGFDYTVSDGNGGIATAHVTVDVAPKADSPVVGFFEVGPATGAEDGVIALKVMQAGVSDTDGSETLRMLITGYPDGATFSVGHAGTGADAGKWVIEDQAAIAAFGTQPLQVTPPANYNGAFTLSVSVEVTDQATLSDGHVHKDVATTDLQTIDVTVTPVNDAPVANSDTKTVLEDGTVFVSAVDGVIRGSTGGAVADSDVDDATSSLVVSGVVAGSVPVTQGAGVGTSIEGTYGHLTLNADGSYSYVADKAAALAAGATAVDTFTYTDKDPSGAVSNTATLQITVTGTDDAPVVAIAGTSGNIGDSTFAGYSSWNGSPKLWTTDWTEGGDQASSTPSNDGDIRVKTESGTGNTYLSFSDYDNTDAYVQRSLNLKGATSATLSFDYQLRGLEQADDVVLVQVSSDGVNFVTIGQLGGGNYDSANFYTISFNISGYASENTTIRFVATAGLDYLGQQQPYDGSIDLINIDNLNVAYTLTPSVSYTENAAQKLVLPNLAISDVDDTRMESATLTLTNAQAGDRLWIGSQQLAQGAAGDVTTASGTIHYTVSTAGGAIAVALSGSATSADYATVLKTIGFDSSSEKPSTVDRIVTVTVNDGDMNSNTTTSLIHVSEVNDKPTVSGVSAGGNEDTVIAISLSGADVDGSVASFKIASLAAHGTLYSDIGLTHALAANDLVTATGNGATVYFKPAADWNGGTSFTYTAIDDRGLASSAAATASITVNAVNDAPVIAGTLSTTVAEGGTHVITVAELGEADPDDSGTGLTYTVSSLNHGTILLNGQAATSFTAQNVIDGQVSFRHDGSEGASAGFGFTLADGGENGATPASGSFAVTVTPVNDGTAGLTLVDTTQTATASKVGDVLQATLGVDPDGAGSNVVYHWMSDGNTINGATGASYTLTSAEVGHTISVYATYVDGQGFASTTATVAQSAPVISSNHAPVAHDDVYTGAATGTPPTGDGWVYNADNGHYYKAVYGNFSFSEAVAAAAGEADGAYLVTITSASENAFVQNLAPLYYQYSWIGASDAAQEGTWRWVTGPEAGQIVTYGNWNIGEPNDWGGEDYALFTRIFGGGWNDADGTSAVPGHDWDYAGYVAEWGGTETAPTEDKAITISAASLLANDSDPDSGDTFSITSVQGASHGTVSLSSDHQTITFTPTANYNGAASFTYTITDSHGLSSTATVTFNVAAVNDAPSGANKTISMVEDVSYAFKTDDFGFTDAADGDHFSGVLITTLPASADGQLLYGNQAVTAGQIISAADIAAGMLSYAPKDNVYGNAGDASFTFQVIDDGGHGGSNVDTDQSPNTMTLDLSTTNYTDVSSSSSSSTTYPDNAGYALTTSTVADQHLSISDGGGGSDRVLLNTSSSTVFTDLDFLHTDNNLEISWSVSGGSRSVTVLDEFSGGRIENFKLDDGGSYQGFSLGSADYTIASGATGSGGNDIIAGTHGSETLNGGTGNDLLFGNGGNDVLIGGKGSDLLVGGAGSDTFTWQSGDLSGGGLDILVDFESGAGGDVIDLSGLLASVSGNHADAVRFVDSGGHSSLASANGSGVLNNGDLTLQVNTGSGWTSVATIKDTGTNLTGGDDVIKMIIDNSQTQMQVHV